MRSSGNATGPDGLAPGGKDHLGQGDRGRGPGFLKVVGLGPGSSELLAPLAARALAQARVIVGYGRYVQLIPEELRAGKEIITAGMKRETERAEKAIESALAGHDTVVVSGGDPGVYGMASLVVEMLESRELFDTLDFEVVPGVPALAAGAALLGAPIGHDFAVISLSDLLTPWEVIENRLEHAAQADFVIVLYNPRSKNRPHLLRQALDVIARNKPAGTVVGSVRQAYRQGCQTNVATLAEYDDNSADMLTIIYIGNSATRASGGLMLTPRGYADKYRV
jgi:precorrin-3B C17-methyltransferase